MCKKHRKKSRPATEELLHAALQDHPSGKPSCYNLAFLHKIFSSYLFFFFFHVINSFINLTAPHLRGFHQLTGRILPGKHSLHCTQEGNVSSL